MEWINLAALVIISILAVIMRNTYKIEAKRERIKCVFFSLDVLSIFWLRGPILGKRFQLSSYRLL